MTEATDGPARLPYVKPFVRNLDAANTQGKEANEPTETTFIFGGHGTQFRVGS
jgi:hypothetical protein